MDTPNSTAELITSSGEDAGHGNIRRVYLLLLILGSFALRVIRLDHLGLAYDEAATALMARASLPQILQFHWQAAFEHPPVWIGAMHFWSRLAGQSEFALRYLPAVAGVAIVPLSWHLVRRLWPRRVDLAWDAVLLIGSAPILVYYSQEARMYSLVVALALLAVNLFLDIVDPAAFPDRQEDSRTSKFAPDALPVYRMRSNRVRILAVWVVVWGMTGLHYFSAILLLLVAALVGLHIMRLRGMGNQENRWPAYFLIFGGAVFPLCLWLLFAPGFHTTLRIEMTEVDTTAVSLWWFLADFWRETTFGAVRWQPPIARIGYVLVPCVVLGFIWVCADARRTGEGHKVSAWGKWLIPVLVAVPLLSAALFLRTIVPRFLLFVVPFFYILTAAAYLVWPARISGRVYVRAFILSVALTINVMGLTHLFGPYVKSDYHTMAQDLRQWFRPDRDVAILEAPRQHLLSQYYLPATWPVVTVPDVELRTYWPVTAPQVVPAEEDDRVQGWLRQYDRLWLLLAGEAEVDAGEFLGKYLDAVAFRLDCEGYLDVRVCQYVSPHDFSYEIELTPGRLYGGDLLLERAALAVRDQSLFVQLDWLAEAQPARDYKLSLRVVGAPAANAQGLETAGPTTPRVVAQNDMFPIGNLLPPTTWAKGDRKSGYMAIPFAAGIPSGRYRVELHVYDPATLEPLPGSHTGGGASMDERNVDGQPLPYVLAYLIVDDTIRLSSIP